MTKKQQEQLDRLTQRITDIYSGAFGGSWSDDDCIGCLGTKEYKSIHDAVKETFDLTLDWMQKNGVGDGCFSFYSICEFESPSRLAKWLFEMGVRA